MEYNAFHELCRDRYSCRRYAPNRRVDRDLLLQCVDAARLAPSACNRQPWRFVIVDDAELRQGICDKCRMPGISHPWWDDVPVFVALCVDREFFTHKFAASISGLPYWALDLGIAGEHFVLAAHSLGLATCWVGWFREKPLKKLLQAPRSLRILSILTVGYAADAEPPNPRPRKATDEISFFNGWSRS